MFIRVKTILIVQENHTNYSFIQNRCGNIKQRIVKHVGVAQDDE